MATPARALARPVTHAVVSPKVPKQVVGYINSDPTGKYQCRGCAMWIDDALRCTGHGKDDVIRAHGSCIHWGPGENATGEEPHGLWTKLDSGYEENVAGFGCTRCTKHFIKSEEDCSKTDKDSEGPDPGKIKSLSCCNYWKNK